MAILNSGRIVASTVIKQSFSNLWNLIKDTSNVPLPVGLPSNHKLVYRRLPHYRGRGFNGFPFIVISRTRPAKRYGTADMTNSFVDYDFMITIYTQDKRSNIDGDPTGADMCDDLTESVRKTLDNISNRKTLIDYGMRNIEYDIDTDEDELDGRAVFISEFDLRIDNNLTTTG